MFCRCVGVEVGSEDLFHKENQLNLFCPFKRKKCGS